MLLVVVTAVSSCVRLSRELPRSPALSPEAPSRDRFRASAPTSSLPGFFILPPLSSACFASSPGRHGRSQVAGQRRAIGRSERLADAGSGRRVAPGRAPAPGKAAFRPQCGLSVSLLSATALVWPASLAASPWCTLSLRVPTVEVSLILFPTQNVHGSFGLPHKFQCVGSGLVSRTGPRGRV